MSERKKRWLRRKDAAQIERNRDSRGSAAGRHCRRFSAAFYIPTCWGGIFQFAYPPIVHHTGTAAGVLRCYHWGLCCNFSFRSDNRLPFSPPYTSWIWVLDIPVLNHDTPHAFYLSYPPY